MDQAGLPHAQVADQRGVGDPESRTWRLSMDQVKVGVCRYTWCDVLALLSYGSYVERMSMRMMLCSLAWMLAVPKSQVPKTWMCSAGPAPMWLASASVSGTRM